MNVGKRIKERRLELGISVDELANRLGKNRTTIYRYEKGDIENLPIDILGPLAKALNTTPAYLMGWDNRPNKDSVTVGELLKLMRLNRNMTVHEYSKEIGITEADLHMYESGDKHIPLSDINIIVDYYRLSMKSLTKGTSKTSSEDSIRLDRFRVWAKRFGGHVFTDEEYKKIVEYAEFLIYARKK